MKENLDRAIEYIIQDVLHDCVSRDDIPMDIKEKIAVLAEFYVKKQYIEDINVEIIRGD